MEVKHPNEGNYHDFPIVVCLVKDVFQGFGQGCVLETQPGIFIINVPIISIPLPLIPLIRFVETRQAIRVAEHPREQTLLDRYANPI